MDIFTHNCGIDAEYLPRYRVGGYHPVHLGDRFQNGRYKVLHKLGYGCYSTVWAARDLINQEYVALKVSVANIFEKSPELKFMRTLAKLNSDEPGSRHITKLLDHFHIVGPNGKHECLVLELLGPSISDFCETWLGYERLPAALAKTSMRQALLGLAYLHKYNIGHGDLHTCNLAFAIPPLHSLTEAELLQKLESPDIGAVTRIDGKKLEPGVPKYLVRPTSFPMDLSLSQQQLKIFDFCQSFYDNDVPETLITPLCLKTPEIIFGQKVDHRVDLWGAGCLIFELITGQPPIDSIVVTPVDVVQQMLQYSSDELPQRWHQKCRTMDNTWTGEKTKNTLQDWLEEVYFDDEKKEEFTREEIVKLGTIIRRLLRFEPSSRASAQEILQDL